MKRYLKQIPLPDAISLITSSFPSPDRTETKPVEQTSGHVVASPVYAPLTIPAVPLASMDGIAVKWEDTIAAQEQLPVRVTVASLISTGQEVTPPYNAVIPSEEIIYSPEGGYLIRKPARNGQNIRKPGEELNQGRLILQPGHRITPSDIGALISYGVNCIEVRTLIIGLIPTGDELVDRSEICNPGQVRESNTTIITASLIHTGIHTIRYPIVRDDPDLITRAILTAVDACDIVIITAGSSAGIRDHTRETIAELGEILFHGVAMRPGKTLLCGNVQGKPVVGLPGQPIASITAWREVVMPLLEHWQYLVDQKEFHSVLAAEAITGNGGIDEFIPVSVVRIAGEEYVFTRPRSDAGQMQMVHADGILRIPSTKEGFSEGAQVTVSITRKPRLGDRILLAGISTVLTDHLQIQFSQRNHHLLFRPMSAIGAAVLLHKGKCHGILLPATSISHDKTILSLLKQGAPDQLVMQGVGEKDGDLLLLIYRNNQEIVEEVSTLITLILSKEWRNSLFPTGCSSLGAGELWEFPSSGMCPEKLPIQSEEITRSAQS